MIGNKAEQLHHARAHAIDRSLHTDSGFDAERDIWAKDAQRLARLGLVQSVDLNCARQTLQRSL